MDQQELEAIMRQRPHLVILGAGATIATIPNGDKYGRKSSVMNNFLEELQLQDLLQGIQLQTTSRNIEDIYSELFDREDCAEVKQKLEERIHKYFSELRIPDEPTIYDLLLLSLRKEDAIVTFNWDDLLLQAYQRVCKITKDLPYIDFLHGNVGAGGCEECISIGSIRRRCNKCGQPYSPSPLLYPVRKKDYTSNFFIREQWEILKSFISRAAVITIFGYSAPQTDVAAKEIIKEYLTKLGDNIHYLDRVEIIEHPDKPTDEIYEAWGFLFDKMRGHIDFHTSFYESLLAEFPRRSIEGFTQRYIGSWWGTSAIGFKITDDRLRNFDTLKELVQPLVDREESGNIEIVENLLE